MAVVILGMVLALGMTAGMFAIVAPDFFEFADSSRDVLRAQSEANRELLSCIDGPGTCTRLAPGEEMVCSTDHDPLTGDETTRCHVERQAPERPPVVEPPAENQGK